VIEKEDQGDQPAFKTQDRDNRLDKLMINRVECFLRIDLKFIEGLFSIYGIVEVVSEFSDVVRPRSTGDKTFLTGVERVLTKGGENHCHDGGNQPIVGVAHGDGTMI
jgi:hypothetical protein